MAGTTSVPRPSFGPAGFSGPSDAEILAGVQDDLNAAFGGRLNPALETPQGQLASSMAAIIADKDSQLRWYLTQVDPATAQGRMQDGIARIYFLTRKPALPTTVQAVCTGQPGVVIPYGAQALASDGSLYACAAAGSIPDGGSVTLPFAGVATGPLPCPATTLNQIYQTVFGWDTISNPADGVLGQDVESRADFETRRSASVALNAQGSLDSIRGTVLALPGVLDVYATENTQAYAVTVGGVTLAPHSIYVAVAGGNPAAVARAIWLRKAPGCDYNGNTTVQVLDTAYAPPYPAYSVTFQTPAPAPVLFAVVIASNPQVPSNALALVQAAVVAAFAGADGGPRARIGATIYASRFYAPVAALGAWAQIVSIELGLGAANGFSATPGIGQIPTTGPGDITLTLA